MKTVEVQSRQKIETECFGSVVDIYQLDLFLMDSVVELTPRDTITRVRYVRASSKAQESIETATTQTRTDSTASKTEETEVTPIAVIKKKNGEAWLCPRVRMAIRIIILIFLTCLLLYVKKNIFLRRN